MANGETRQVPIDEAMQLAVDHQRQGQPEQAAAIYRAVLAADPGHAGASHNLGVITLRSGRAAEAVPLFKAALDADPTLPAYWQNYAVALAGSGDPGAARDVLLEARLRGMVSPEFGSTLEHVEKMIATRAASLRERSATEPGPGGASPDIDALVRLFNENRHAELENLASRIIVQSPHDAAVWHLLGASRLVRGLAQEAYDALDNARRYAGENAEILNLLGVSLFRMGRLDEARQAFEQSLVRDPTAYETLINASANALAAGDPDATQALAQRAVAQRPTGVEALFALGNAAAAKGRNEEAADFFTRAIAVAPESADLYMNLGNVLTNLGRRDEATRVLEKALALRPDHAGTHLNLGRALHELGESAAAQRHFRSASDLDRSLTEAHSAYLFSLIHDSTTSPQQAFEEHVRIGRVMGEAPGPERRPHQNDPDPDRPLRIGFVSGDLFDHPVANFVEPVWRAIRRAGHRVHAYSNAGIRDAVTDRLRGIADDWVQVERMGDEALCECVRDDRIDILVDLSGHTARNRLPAFARKPAPVQVSWIGYPGTTGLTAMDYRFIRNAGQPPAELQKLFVEKLACLAYRGFEPSPEAPDVNAPPALSKGHLTLGSFNRPSKISEAVVSLWSRVLLAIPGSRLLIAGVVEERVAERLRELFASRGIAPERIDVHRRLSLPQYLALHHDVDFALDTFPYTGGTTTYHALWMGVPTLTIAGSTMQQNQAANALRNLGLTAWVADSEDAFVRQAASAAADLHALAMLRSGLRHLAEPHFLGTEARNSHELDAALRTMWRRWCAREEPVAFTVEN